MRCLIVTGDDFGASRGVNRGIVQAARHGILTSASLMVNRPASADAAMVSRECPAVSLGLHLELEPDAHRGTLAELERQLGRFLELTGDTPTHVDSHHDVHRDPRVLPHVLRWAEEAGLPVRGHSAARHVSRFYGRHHIGVDEFVRLLDTAVSEGVTELSCHPGYVDSELRSSYAAPREVEVRTLCDEEVRRAIGERGIRLIGFRDLPTLDARSSGVGGRA